MAEDRLFALRARALEVCGFTLSPLVDEHGHGILALELVMQDLPTGGMAALVLPAGNPLTMHLSESLARDLRQRLEQSDPPRAHTANDGVASERTSPIPVSAVCAEGDDSLLGFHVRVLCIRSLTMEACVDQNAERFIQFEVLVRDLPTDTQLALLLPEGNPVVMHLSESLARDLWKALVDTEWWAEPAELC